jgi:hypothetical protein
MKKILFFALVFMALGTQTLKAQYYYYNDRYFDGPVVFEMGLSGGIMNSLTDLGGKKGAGKKFIKDLRWATARPSYGAYFMATYNNAISARIEGTVGNVVGYDSILKNVASSSTGRYERNLSFKSKISEVQLGIEVHPLFIRNMQDIDPPRLSPYIILGVGYFSFDPQGNLDGNWYSLKPLHTEGEGFKEYPDKKNYQLSQLNLLGGLGLRYELTDMFNVRLELVQRKLFTDYLDDVSTTYIDPNLFYTYLPANMAVIAQRLANRKAELNPTDITNVGDQRGNSSNKDSYFTIQLKVGMTLGRPRR